MRGRLGRALLAAASFALAFLLLEVGLRVAGYEPIYAVYSRPSIFWIHDELLGWRHEPNASGTYVGPRPFPVEFRTPIRINSLGLRGPELSELPPGGARVLVLGDSTVASFEVAWEKTFVVLLERSLSRRLGFPVQMINAGVRGYGTDQSALYYGSRGRTLEPDLVVMVHAKNDPLNNVTLHRMRRPFGKAAFALRDDGRLELVGRPVRPYPLCSAWGLDASFEPVRIDGPGARAACRLQLSLADRSALFTFVTLRLQRSSGWLRWLYGLGTPQETASLQVNRAGVGPELSGPRGELAPEPARRALTTALYRHLAGLVRTDGAAFLAVIGAEELARFDQQALAADGIPVHRLEVRSRFLEPSQVVFENDAHFNALGHQLLAEHLTPVLARAIEAARSGSSRPPATAGAW